MQTSKQNQFFRTALNFTFNPFWHRVVALCKSKEELFEQVEPEGFINPDGLREITAQGLYSDYLNWKNNGTPLQDEGNPVNKIIDKIVND